MAVEHTHSNIPRHPSPSDAFVLDLDLTTTTAGASDQEHITQIEEGICLPLPAATEVLLSQSTIDRDALQNYLLVGEGDSTHTKYDLKLDLLLDTSQNKHSRRFSDFDDIPFDPSNVKDKTGRYTYYDTSVGSLPSSSFKELLLMPTTQDDTVVNLLTESLCWWIDVFAPTDQEMRVLSRIFCIHPLTTEDIQAQESRGKCEIFQNYMFISFRSFNHDYSSQEYLEAVNFYIIVFKNGVLTFRFKPLPHPHNVRKRIHLLKDYIKITPEWINYALIDNVTDSFAPLLQQIELEVDSIDDLILVLSVSEQTDMLRRIGSCRKMVMQLLRLLGPKADVARRLIKRYEDKAKETEFTNLRKQQNPQHTKMVQGTNIVNDISFQHEIVLFLGDIQDHLNTMLQNVNHYDLVLGRAHRNYLGQISIELSQAGNDTNVVINRLTFMATLVIPLNLVTGLFGINVEVPGKYDNDLAWFFWILGGMGLFMTFMVCFGKRFGFL